MKPLFKYLAVILALGLFALSIFLYITINAKYQNKLARIHNWDGRKFCVEMSLKSTDSDPSKLFNVCEKDFKEEFFIPEYQY